MHSDSLDTLLYVRFAIQNLEFYEWKLRDQNRPVVWARTAKKKKKRRLEFKLQNYQ